MSSALMYLFTIAFLISSLFSLINLMSSIFLFFLNYFNKKTRLYKPIQFFASWRIAKQATQIKKDLQGRVSSLQLRLNRGKYSRCHLGFPFTMVGTHFMRFNGHKPSSLINLKYSGLLSLAASPFFAHTQKVEDKEVEASFATLRHLLYTITL